MTTVYDISIQMMRNVTDVLNGAATGGTDATLIDTVNIVGQPNEYWKNGSLWIHSGTHAGKVLRVSSHVGNTLGFPTLASAIAAGVRFSVARGIFPWEQVMGAIQQALDTTWVTGHDESLTGDGVTLSFPLPDGVQDVYDVQVEKANGMICMAGHWKERIANLEFDNGYPVADGDIIHIYYKDQHEIITGYSTAINAEINTRWLVPEAAKNLLVWGLRTYGKKPDLMLEDSINIMMNRTKGMRSRRGIPL